MLYPDFQELLKLGYRASKLNLMSRRKVRSIVSGDHRSPFRGKGLEFEEVREYTPGDDVRSIDWNVSARYGDPYVKVFREERELTTYGYSASEALRRGAGEKRPHLHRCQRYHAVRNAGNIQIRSGRARGRSSRLDSQQGKQPRWRHLLWQRTRRNDIPRPGAYTPLTMENA